MNFLPAYQRLVLPVILLVGASCLLQSVATNVKVKAHPATEDNFKVTTVFLIRHAEKAEAPREDPPLNDSGRLRSQALSRILGQSDIKAIYTSQYQRTIQTAEPLAKQLGITATSLPLKMSQSNPREVSEQSIKEITGKIYERAGEASLVIGHSNTIPEVIKMLGGDNVPKIDEQKFDDLFVVTIFAKGKAKVVHLKYEAAS
jgi:phosphohistidine phosphatase SixA